jgi:hypothetical protein
MQRIGSPGPWGTVSRSSLPPTASETSSVELEAKLEQVHVKSLLLSLHHRHVLTLFTVYAPPIHSLVPAYSLPIPCLFTAYISLRIHCLG